jgi:hypothetical protein
VTCCTERTSQGFKEFCVISLMFFSLVDVNAKSIPLFCDKTHLFVRLDHTYPAKIVVIGGGSRSHRVRLALQEGEEVVGMLLSLLSYYRLR